MTSEESLTRNKATICHLLDESTGFMALAISSEDSVSSLMSIFKSIPVGERLPDEFGLLVLSLIHI